MALRLALLALLPGAAGLTCQDAALRAEPFCDATLPVSERVADLLPRLNVSQMLGQMTGIGPAIPELGVVEYNYGGEALHGIWSTCVNASDGSLKCPTQFGSPLSMSCSFNRRLWRAMASATSTEIRAFYDFAASGGESAKSLEGLPFGLSYYTPNINIMRDPRWGRSEETPGEDPYLNGEYGYAFTKGFQEGDDDDDQQGIEEGKERFGTSYWKANVVVKHFVAYSLETSTIPSYANHGADPSQGEGGGFINRHAFDAIVSDQDLAETYLPAFHRAVDADAGGIMCSYNAINGVPACVNSEMLRGVLRGDFRFNGIVATDCGALNDAQVNHNYSKTLCPSCNTTAQADLIASLAVKAGVDSNCGSFMTSHMPEVMAKHMVPETTLAQSTGRLLALRFKLGLFEPNHTAVPKAPLSAVDSAKHRAIALKQARQGIVLLKNAPAKGSGGKPLLPLAKGKKVAMIGPNANASLNLLSGYHGTPPFLVSPLQAMRAALGEAHVEYAVGCNVTNVSWGGIGGGTVHHPPKGVPPHQGVSPQEAQAHIDAAVALAKKSDVAVLGLGLCGDNYGLNGGRKLGDPEGEDITCFTIEETETTDRLSLELPGLQNRLLKAVVATGVPVVVFVINAGPVDLSWAKENVAAIVSAGYGGEYGGQGIADVLTGAYNPGGALTYTLHTEEFARKQPYDSMEMRPNKTTGAPGRGYRFLDTEGCPGCLSWPFGYGGSYTRFAIEWAAPPRTAVALGDDTVYELSVRNTGARTGDVVVTCFVAAEKQAEVAQPPRKQLFEFDRVEELAAGGSASLAFTLSPEGRALVTGDGRRAVVPGQYRVVCSAGGIVSVSAELRVE